MARAHLPCLGRCAFAFVASCVCGIVVCLAASEQVCPVVARLRASDTRRLGRGGSESPATAHLPAHRWHAVVRAARGAHAVSVDGDRPWRRVMQCHSLETCTVAGRPRARPTWHCASRPLTPPCRTPPAASLPPEFPACSSLRSSTRLVRARFRLADRSP
jgi:hypothetical protein